MGVYSKAPEQPKSRFIEWHARLIYDPVARLRYLRRTTHVAPPAEVRRIPRYVRFRPAVLTGAMLLFPAPYNPTTVAPLAPAPARKAGPAPEPIEASRAVWPVEKSEAFEIYSNGLRIENLFAVSNRSRAYKAIPQRTRDAAGWETRTEPAGIVFHTTESHLAAFEAGRNGELQAASMGLLDYVRRNRSYHFVIDRFGRVHRVVQETDSANHAGWSVWADEDWIYVNLNDSFLGIAFEARHQTAGGLSSVSPAQIHAGRVLTEMLLAKYHIRPANCVAHAQVSVNPGNFRIGYHTDWAASLPFRELGLPDNYERPLPSLTLFGFSCDAELAGSGDDGLSRGLQAAEGLLRHEAAAREMPLARYRAVLQRQYREITTALESESAARRKCRERKN